MLRYSILVISAVLAITAAASAQITVTIGGGQNGHYYPPNQRPVYYPQQGGYYVNNQSCPPGQVYHTQRVRHDNRKVSKRGKHKNRHNNRWVQQNHCPPRRF